MPFDTSRPARTFAPLEAGLAGRYRVERELESSEPSTNYLAREAASDRPVVLGVVRLGREDPEVVARAVERLRAAAGVEGRHLLPILDAGPVADTSPPAVYYAVPFVPGETLRTRLDREGRLPVVEALGIAEGVAQALESAHKHGLVHGAVAAERIVLAGGEARLADLGLAAALGAPATDTAADLQALGLVLYEMLAGAPPPPGSVPPLRPVRAGIPEELELVIARMLAPDPAQRYRSAEDVRAALRKAAVAAEGLALPGAVTRERAALRRNLPARWSVFSLAIAGLMVLTLWLRYTAPVAAPAPPPPARPGSVAVLPFVNATPDSANLILTDGLTRDLTSRLGALPGLRVTGAASAYHLGGARTDPRRAGERLGVDAVLHGSVRPGEGRLRLRAQLVSVREGFDLWSETYDREATELVPVQREIVTAVAGALRLDQAPDSGGATPRPEAYLAYLRGMRARERDDSAALRQAVASYQQAVGLDSSFAAGWAALAEQRLRRGAHDSLGPVDAAAEAREAAERALALDGGLAEAHRVLGAVRFRHEWDWAAAETSLRRSLALNPNEPATHLELARLLLTLGRVDEAIEASRRALELSPLDPEVRLQVARQALHVGDYVRAEEEAGRAMALEPGLPAVDLLGGLVAAATGRYEDALPLLRRAASDSARIEARAVLAWALALAGRRGEAREIQAALVDTSATRYVSPYHLAYLAEALGDRRGAFAALDRAVQQRAPELVELRVDPRMDRLRVDRRLDAVARRVGLP